MRTFCGEDTGRSMRRGFPTLWLALQQLPETGLCRGPRRLIWKGGCGDLNENGSAGSDICTLSLQLENCLEGLGVVSWPCWGEEVWPCWEEAWPCRRRCGLGGRGVSCRRRCGLVGGGVSLEAGFEVTKAHSTPQRPRLWVGNVRSQLLLQQYHVHLIDAMLPAMRIMD